jgi:hypothetical protein
MFETSVDQTRGCYVEAEGRSEDREGIRHATCLRELVSFRGKN